MTKDVLIKMKKDGWHQLDSSGRSSDFTEVDSTLILIVCIV